MRARHQHGLTLLEVLVVLVLIGIITSVAVLTLNVHDPDAAMRREAQRLAGLLGLARQQAMLSARPLALRFEHEGYAFMQWRNGHWSALTHDRVLRPRQLPAGMAIEAALRAGSAGCRDGVVFMPSGEVTPCVIGLRLGEAALGDAVRINRLGAVRVGAEAGSGPAPSSQVRNEAARPGAG